MKPNVLTKIMNVPTDQAGLKSGGGGGGGGQLPPTGYATGTVLLDTSSSRYYSI